MDLHIGPSSINKQEVDTLVTAMYYHVLAPEDGSPTGEEHFIEKKITRCKVIFSSHTCKLNPQMQRGIVSKGATTIFPSNKYDFVFLMFLSLTNHEKHRL